MSQRNGTPPAPHVTGGAFPYHRPRTEFLPDLPVAGWRAVLYHLDRQQFLGLRLIRWLYLALVAGGLLWGAASLPGGWWISLFCLLVSMLLALGFWRNRRQGFVRFQEGPSPSITPWPMPPSYKVAVYACGKLTVENKVRLFVGIPGFYRSFATREHALLCQARTQRFGPGRWPEDEEGLWYAFFMPDAIKRVRTGTVELARATMPALAIDYRPAPVPGRRQGAKLADIETILLAFQDEDDRIAALSDLLTDAPAVVTAGTSTRIR